MKDIQDMDDDILWLQMCLKNVETWKFMMNAREFKKAQNRTPTLINMIGTLKWFANNKKMLMHAKPVSRSALNSIVSQK